MANKCFYCEVKGITPHLDGCPHKIYREISDQIFGNAVSNLEVVAIALSPSSRRIDRKAEEAIEQFERGYDDGSKIESARQPSDHPSYKLGLNRALAEFDEDDEPIDDGGGAARFPDAGSHWENWEDVV